MPQQPQRPVSEQFIRGVGILAVLKLLDRTELHGYGIVERLTETPGGALHLGHSTIYPMLYNLEAKGLIKARWDERGARPRKLYSLTAAGRERLNTESRQWRDLVKAMTVLGLPSPPAVTT